MLLTLSEPQSSANWKKNHLKLSFLYSGALGEAESNILLTLQVWGCRPWEDNCPFYGWLSRSLINSLQMDLATRWCGFESPHWVSGFKSFSCVSTIFVKINIDCQLNRIRITMETNSSMCLGGSFLIALTEVKKTHHQYELHHSTGWGLAGMKKRKHVKHQESSLTVSWLWMQ